VDVGEFKGLLVQNGFRVRPGPSPGGDVAEVLVVASGLAVRRLKQNWITR
jgi:hypothetical protein